MSNLLKQYAVVNSQGGNRIINCNRLAEERIRKWVASAVVNEDVGTPDSAVLEEPSEFSEGLVAEEIVAEPQPDPNEIAKQILDEAREKADQLLNDAAARAKQTIADARTEAEALFEEQKALGYEEGAGQKIQELEELKIQMEREALAREEESVRRAQELEEEFLSRQERMEEDIVDALIPVFEKVFQVQFGEKREILLALIANTLANVELGDKLRIRVNEADHAMLNEHLPEIRAQAGSDVSLEIIQDAKLPDGSCQIETAYGIFDCGIDTHFTNLIQDIRSLV